MYQASSPVYVEWVPTSGNNIPKDAVVGGYGIFPREDLFIGKFNLCFVLDLFLSNNISSAPVNP